MRTPQPGRELVPFGEFPRRIQLGRGFTQEAAGHLAEFVPQVTRTLAVVKDPDLVTEPGRVHEVPGQRGERAVAGRPEEPVHLAFGFHRGDGGQPAHGPRRARPRSDLPHQDLIRPAAR